MCCQFKNGQIGMEGWKVWRWQDIFLFNVFFFFLSIVGINPGCCPCLASILSLNGIPRHFMLNMVLLCTRQYYKCLTYITSLNIPTSFWDRSYYSCIPYEKTGLICFPKLPSIHIVVLWWLWENDIPQNTNVCQYSIPLHKKA